RQQQLAHQFAEFPRDLPLQLLDFPSSCLSGILAQRNAQSRFRNDQYGVVRSIFQTRRLACARTFSAARRCGLSSIFPSSLTTPEFGLSSNALTTFFDHAISSSLGMNAALTTSTCLG